MSMDLKGRNPSSGDGEECCISVWAWHPILQIIEELCSDILTEEMIRKMSYNDGHGPTSQQTCDTIAERLEAWLKEHPDGRTISHEQAASETGGGWLLRLGEISPLPNNVFTADPDRITYLIRFLRSCGGFKVN